MTPRHSAHMTIMVAAAQKAARRLVRDFNEVEHLQVSVKGPSDFVSQADMRAEQTIREELERARPGYAFLMEESGAHGSENWAWRWIVDPLDGTTNFLHAIPNWAISIALEKRLPDGGSEIVAGLVMAPALDELFWAEKGVGTYLNDRRLRVSSRRDWSAALFATGIPFARTAPRNRLAFARVLGALMPETAGVRRVGAASLDLAWTAAGRYEGYWEFGTHLWDIAAGALMVREAGGYATAPDGSDALSGDIVAGNPHIHPRLRELVGSALESAKA
ncbi:MULTISPECIES: inositol monophosphatase family protein [unclassified Acidiphilium]|uniref:inositol monophosphatase family protein n=1 Tax=unclassified Acidiphilium TaxID=2617493 RepID=UPI000BCE5E5C|nr:MULTISPECIES: inositol monophosphatase family protein [unclassified Acidiphilium]OYV54855.1 MAG: inositol monophosphatase [Acidiphilium sp. 20-67-58]HQT62337.1 inositol monophosphatase family protein [Acidiphilium sp.]